MDEGTEVRENIPIIVAVDTETLEALKGTDREAAIFITREDVNDLLAEGDANMAALRAAGDISD